eukprot:CAMPEP_0185275794 /NCGR_PEP_ID=MMETSP1359-20130426/54758_1 /TAXON_ID=552665 /ORGANISM="Bigelowiella longifila, Strain CCMP242" /LENGTH=82 /DNA_ID=CAMNT_0027869255 /DNA_START=182 /DNA_END=427 /DNA_ORIENTATION=+
MSESPLHERPSPITVGSCMVGLAVGFFVGANVAGPMVPGDLDKGHLVEGASEVGHPVGSTVDVGWRDGEQVAGELLVGLSDG